MKPLHICQDCINIIKNIDNIQNTNYCPSKDCFIYTISKDKIESTAIPIYISLIFNEDFPYIDFNLNSKNNYNFSYQIPSTKHNVLDTIFNIIKKSEYLSLLS